MNKRFEAVPRKVWRSNNPDKDILDNDVRIMEIDGITHVLVPIQKDGWISVDDQLPEPGVLVLIHIQFGNEKFEIKTSYIAKDHNEWNEFLFLNITHWMPLPSSPKDTEQLKDK